MLTCCVRYEIDPFKKAQFERYARVWGEAIPRCGADLIGYFAPHELHVTLTAVRRAPVSHPSRILRTFAERYAR